MHKDLAEFAIKFSQKKGASYAEARLETGSGIDASLKNGILQGLGFSEYSGIGIRIVHNNYPVFFSTNDLDKRKIKYDCQKDKC